MSAGSQHPQENQKREWGGVGGNRDIKGQKEPVCMSLRGERERKVMEMGEKTKKE